MTITGAQENGVRILTLEGRLDTNTAPELQAALVPLFDTEKDVRLDLTGIAYVSSAGLRVLLAGHKAAKAKGASMRVAHVSAEVMEVFEMTGFSNVLNIE
jgi:anti-anti-sigma factor